MAKRLRLVYKDGESETYIVVVPFYVSMLAKNRVLWHTDPLLGNDRETNSETKAIARQQLRKYAKPLAPLLGSYPRATMEVLLEAPSLYHWTDCVEVTNINFK
jgi:hypothetical protein